MRVAVSMIIAALLWDLFAIAGRGWPRGELIEWSAVAVGCALLVILVNRLRRSDLAT